MANKTETRIMAARDAKEIHEIIQEITGYQTTNPKFLQRALNAAEARQKQLDIAETVQRDAAKRVAKRKQASEGKAPGKTRNKRERAVTASND